MKQVDTTVFAFRDVDVETDGIVSFRKVTEKEYLVVPLEYKIPSPT